ncbi:DNA mismatch repair protein MutT [Rhizobium sp. H4]|uniref:DNA mismatch repair protein MutT n=1 Tax=Rhizobium TaxID=379 RepID=UPI000BE9EB39|nr:MULTISPECIES: DNA mismatch repair protein MutT [Rhizobium]PDV86278.1 DNA mismatch repair protein MutT [Rhizobium sp. H4]WET74733.1 DNA mismatch repair protein MutT [Rhizobium croatiense]
MTVWRPPQQIRVKVIGLAWRQDRLLAAEVEDDGGRIKGIRPLGGSIEFGETREQALQREFREADIELADASLYARDEIRYAELDETAATARWFGRDMVRDADIDLYPTGLEKVLSRWRD